MTGVVLVPLAVLNFILSELGVFMFKISRIPARSYGYPSFPISWDIGVFYFTHRVLLLLFTT